MIVSKLRAEIDAFLQIGLTQSQLVSDREIPAPGSTAMGHSYLHLGFNILSEELPAESFQPLSQAFVHTVSDDIKESALAARSSDLGGHGVTVLCPADQRADVNDRDAQAVIISDFFHCFHRNLER